MVTRHFTVDWTWLVIVCLLVVVLGVSSGGLAPQEQLKSNDTNVTKINKCGQDSGVNWSGVRKIYTAGRF